jgi:hypothetical protein
MLSSVALGCAVALGAVFGTSLVTKLGRVRFRAFVGSAGPLELFPVGWRSRVAGVVVAAELVVTTAVLGWGVSVALGRHPGWLRLVGFGGAGCVLVGFTVGISIALRRGERAPCQCFGASATPMGLAHIVRNLVLIATTVFGAVSGESSAALEPAGVVLAVVVGAFVAAVIVNVDHVVELFRDSRVAGNAG